jgi:hypothetical protein
MAPFGGFIDSVANTPLHHRVDYSIVNPDNKWKILKSQSRFAMWCE